MAADACNIIKVADRQWSATVHFPVAGAWGCGFVDLLQKCYFRNAVIKKKLNENKNIERKFAFLVDISIFAA